MKDILRLSDDEIKYILQNRNEMLEANHTRMQELYDEMFNLNEMIRTVSLSSLEVSVIGKAKGTNQDLTNTFLRYQQMPKDSEMEIRAGIFALVEEKEAINRVWVCYQALPVQEYEIIHNLYVEKRLYKTVESDLGWNHRKFETLRKQAINRIRNMYESNMTNIDIISGSGRKMIAEGGRRKRWKKKENG